MLPDYYSILAVRSDASPGEIRAAYRCLAKLHHPDVGGARGDFQAVQEAHDVLSDLVRRCAYDAQRAKARDARSIRAVPTPAHSDENPEPLIPSQPLRVPRSTVLGPGNPLVDFERLFREFDEFFERLERQFLRPSWGRNE